MTFREALNSTFRENYGTFSGRASRSEHWYVFLFFILFISGGTAVVLTLSTGLWRGGAVFATLLIIAVLFGVIVPMLALVVRRFHDVGLPGWWYSGAILVSFAPFLLAYYGGLEVSEELANLPGIFASLAVFVVTVWPSAKGVNEYGENPSGVPDVGTFE